MKYTCITPEAAQRYLDTQRVNRAVSRKTVSEYAAAMNDGKWIANGRVPISVDSSGRLVDGQHRMMALVEHGQPIHFYVSTVDDETLEIMHRTRARSLADRMMIDGFAGAGNAKLITSIGVALCERRHFWHIGMNGKRTSLATRTYRVDEIKDAYGHYGLDRDVLASEARQLYDMQPSRSRLVIATTIGYLLAQGVARTRHVIMQIICDDHPERGAAAASVRLQLLNSHMSPSFTLALMARAINRPDARKVRMPSEIEDIQGGIFDREEVQR
jgi:hypothetical protein